MKKWIALLLVCIFLLGAVPMASAASATAKVTANKSTVTVGGTVTVTIAYTADVAVAGAQGFLNYDTTAFEFVSATKVTANGDAGSVKFSYFDALSTAKTFSFDATFRAKSTGSGKFTLSTTELLDADISSLGNPSGSTTISVQNPSLSGNADLTELYISSGSLSPAFSPKVTSYNIVIPNNVTVLTVSAETADKNAKITVEGSKNMQVGKNVRKVIVTAPNGTKKTYTLNITRQEGTGNETGTTTTPNAPATDASKVTVGEETLYIAKDLKDVTLPAGFEQVALTVNDAQFPSVQDKSRTVVLLYLTDADGKNGKFYMYDTAAMTFSDFTHAVVPTGVYTFLTPDSAVAVPAGFTQTFVKVGEQTISAWSFPDATWTEYYLVYALSPTGNKGLYQYDTVEGTFQRYTATATVPSDTTQMTDDDPTEEKKGVLVTVKGWYNSLLTRFGLVRLLVLTGGAVLLIAALIVLIVLLAKRPKNCKH